METLSYEGWFTRRNWQGAFLRVPFLAATETDFELIMDENIKSHNASRAVVGP